jgi:hypothetical protein
MYDRIENPIQAIEKMGEWISKSGLFGCDKLEQGMVLAMTSYAERRPMTDICRRYHIVEGKLSMKAEAMLAEFNQRGGQHVWVKSDDKEAILSMTFGPYKDFQVSYTIKDAERAELCGPNGAQKKNQTKPGSWQKIPDAMLRARCSSKAVRMVCPEIVVGIYTPEELSDAPLPQPPVRVLSFTTSSASNDPKEPVVVDAVDTPANSEAVEAEQPPPEPENPKLAKLKEVVSGFENDATAWLIEKGWIKTGEGLCDLASDKVEQIMARPGLFKTAVTTWKNDKKKG